MGVIKKNDKQVKKPKEQGRDISELETGLKTGAKPDHRFSFPSLPFGLASVAKPEAGLPDLQAAFSGEPGAFPALLIPYPSPAFTPPI